MNMPMSNAAPSSSDWTRAALRARFEVSRKVTTRGDNATAARLRSSDDSMLAEQLKVDANLPPVPAAVLVPLVEHGAGFTVLFTQRTADLKAHGGQISFPGGRMEPFDADAFAGALRETAEEIGLAASHIEILGTLDPYLTVTGFVVTPVVGVVTPPFELKPDPTEVADLFEVPLAFFLDPANHQRHSRTLSNGVVSSYYAIPFGDRYIWGATAGMLINLYEVLAAENYAEPK
jgi:8-oxo-dGTP pyrophosphatase MutT (NUDIX family)